MLCWGEQFGVTQTVNGWAWSVVDAAGVAAVPAAFTVDVAATVNPALSLSRVAEIAGVGVVGFDAAILVAASIDIPLSATVGLVGLIAEVAVRGAVAPFTT